MIRKYRLILANRSTQTYTRGRFFGPRPDSRGSIVLGDGAYLIDPTKVTYEVKTGILGGKKDVLVQYYRAGNRTPMDPLDFAASPGADTTTLKTFRDAGFIGNLFRSEMDLTKLLLIMAILGNMVLGGIIYSLVK